MNTESPDYFFINLLNDAIDAAVTVNLMTGADIFTAEEFTEAFDRQESTYNTLVKYYNDVAGN